jgi:hypothetical protein
MPCSKDTGRNLSDGFFVNAGLFYRLLSKTGSFRLGSSGGLRLAGWTAAKRSASVGRKSSDARFICMPV